MPLSLFAPLDTLISTPPERARVAFLAAQPFAHRGLHGGARIENSRGAFAAAIALGHGIELDVQAALGGEVFVFHDAELDRLTNQSGAIADCTAHDLDLVTLKNSIETIPRLVEILALVKGQVPILIEVKAPDRGVGILCAGVRRALEGYQGPVAIMSFNPDVGRWFDQHAPRTVRGLVMTEGGPQSGWARIKARGLRHIALWRAKPDFLAYDINDLPSPFASAQRTRGLPILTWTVRTAEQEHTAFAHADEVIYEKPVAITR